MRISKMVILFVLFTAIAISCLIIDTDVETDVSVEGDINVSGNVPDPTDEIVEGAKNAFGLSNDDDSGAEEECDL